MRRNSRGPLSRSSTLSLTVTTPLQGKILQPISARNRFEMSQDNIAVIFGRKWPKNSSAVPFFVSVILPVPLKEAYL